MIRRIEKSETDLALLANGSSGPWQVDVDESIERANDWSVTIEGPQTYLAFQLTDLAVIPEIISFLERGLAGRLDPPKPDRATLGPQLLGKFGSYSVSLVWDNEDFPRCFLVIGPQARSTMHLSLSETDIRMLLDAFRQVAEDISPTVNP